ncbi:MAG TPA: LytTR family DNA-binding domain-containing protein [Gemmatimonadota bacterium]|nr:LytTR family DNA-binding domain-containing protein [Gemmatimonadota bacterium]
MNDPIRTLLVDDEALARRRLRTLLRGDPGIEIVGECGDGGSAVKEIEALAPDLVFLDVQMPEADGFDVLDAVGARAMPVVVFVTAYDGYALRAFEVHALDYLLKPFSRDRFEAALARAREEIRRRRGDGPQDRDELAALLRELREAGRRPRRLVVRDGGRVSFISVEEIDWVESAGNYLRIHVGPDAHLIRGTIKGCTEKLDSESFLRISRSTIVNLDRVRAVHPWTRGELIVVMRDGTQLPTTGDHGRRLRERLKPGL